MPWADYRKKLEANRRYAATPAGKAAKARSHQRYIEKRRSSRPLPINPQPLASVVSHWTHQ